MASAKQFYELSPEADCDLESIFDDTDSNFGLKLAHGATPKR